jgi:hypothetical protein
MWLLLLLPNARAWSPDSLRAEATFGLFRDSYDLLREPAGLAENPEPHVYTLLGNQGGSDRLSAGFIGQLGPGVLGFIADGTTDGSSSRTTSVVAATAATAETTSERTTQSATRSGGIYAGYGIPLREGVAVAVGVQTEARGWSTTLAPVPGSSPLVGGTLEQTSDADGSSSTQQGHYDERERDSLARVGANFQRPRFDLEVDLSLAHLLRNNSGAASQSSDDLEYEWSGAVEAASLDSNVSAWLPGAAVDLTVPMTAELAVRAFVGGQFGPATLVTTQTRELYTDYVDPSLSEATTTDLRGASADLAEADGLLALHVDRGDLQLRVGAAGAWERSRLDVGEFVEVDGVGTETALDRREQAAFAQGLVAIEQRANDRWLLRAGASWTHSWLSSNSSSTLLTSPSEGQTIDTDSIGEEEASYLELAFGARLDLGPVLLDATVRGTGLPDEQRVGVDLSSLLLSLVWRPRR